MPRSPRRVGVHMSFDLLSAQVIGPRPLRRALQAYAALEPMRFRYIDTIHTVVRGRSGLQSRASHGITDRKVSQNLMYGSVQ